MSWSCLWWWIEELLWPSSRWRKSLEPLLDRLQFGRDWHSLDRRGSAGNRLRSTDLLPDHFHASGLVGLVTGSGRPNSGSGWPTCYPSTSQPLFGSAGYRSSRPNSGSGRPTCYPCTSSSGPVNDSGSPVDRPAPICQLCLYCLFCLNFQL